MYITAFLPMSLQKRINRENDWAQIPARHLVVCTLHHIHRNILDTFDVSSHSLDVGPNRRNDQTAYYTVRSS